MISVVSKVMSVVGIIAGCLFLVYNLFLWRRKVFLEIAELSDMAYPDEHDRIVEELAEIMIRQHRNRYCYIVLFTLSLIGYVCGICLSDGVIPFDLMTFCLSATTTVSVTLFMSWFGKTDIFKRMRYPRYLELLRGALLAALWIITMFFFFFLFPWSGCLMAVLFIIIGLVAIRLMNKYGRKNDRLWQG